MSAAIFQPFCFVPGRVDALRGEGSPRLAPGTYYYRVAGTDRYGQRVELSLDGSGQPLQFVVP